MFQTNTTDHLVRSNLWSSQIKEVLEDELLAMKYVKMLTEFGDGETFNIPSIGQAEVHDYVEGQAVRYTGMDTGNFTLTITDYVQSAMSITNKAKQDWFYMQELVSSFVPSMSRAIMKAMEVDVLALGPNAQTAANTNAINGAEHRFIGTGTAEIIAVADFAKAKYALQKANVPMTNLVAIVDPSVEYTLSTLTNLTNVSNNPRWEGVVSTGMSTGTRFLMNIYGFDVYSSQNLKVNTASETIGALTAAAGVNNLFFSATSDVSPFVGILRQPPKVDSSYNKDFQRDEYVTTARWGFKLFRPENLVVVVTDIVV